MVVVEGNVVGVDDLASEIDRACAELATLAREGGYERSDSKRERLPRTAGRVRLEFGDGRKTRGER